MDEKVIKQGEMIVGYLADMFSDEEDRDDFPQLVISTNKDAGDFLKSMLLAFHALTNELLENECTNILDFTHFLNHIAHEIIVESALQNAVLDSTVPDIQGGEKLS